MAPMMRARPDDETVRAVLDDLEEVRNWLHEAPIAELEAVERALGRNAPIQAINDAIDKIVKRFGWRRTSEEFLRNMGAAIDFATTVKREMLAARLDRAQRKCPRCGGTVFFALTVRKKHLRAVCQTENCLEVIE